MAADDQEDVKPKMNLAFSFEGQTCVVKVRPTMPFKKILETVEKRFGSDPGTFKFTFDGQRINPENTPSELEMQDGDTIDAHLGQVGGALAWSR